MITVYSQPGCHSCEDTKAYLVKHKVQFTDRNIRGDAQALKELGALGYQATPVVVSGDQHWAGHDPARLAKLIG
jgi:glutaredoxin-like protein NrdH